MCQFEVLRISYIFTYNVRFVTFKPMFNVVASTVKNILIDIEDVFLLLSNKMFILSSHLHIFMSGAVMCENVNFACHDMR